MFKGTLFALAACFLWGLIFIVPTFLQEFDPIEIALGRHFVYGTLSIFFFLFSIKTFFNYSLKIWGIALLFALIVNIFYYSCLVLCVNHASPSIAALMTGMSPILISFYGNFLEKECRYKDLVIPALLILIGLLFINIPALQTEETSSKPFYWIGLLGAVCSLLAWSWYVVTNARFLKRHPEIPPSSWSTLLGTATLFWVLLLGILYESWQGTDHWQKFITPSESLQNYLIGCLILGFFCSWVGAYFWNRASTLLPVSFAGELSIFETLFGLLFFYLLKQDYPPLYEVTGITLMLLAIVYSMSENRARLRISTSNKHF